ncbi:MAG: hypothetical protein RL660_1454 [Bacteroidota bacterium]|jgi:uncharacterized protein YqeY
MSLEITINEGIKKAMLAKAEVDLRALRAIKSAILLAKTSEGSTGELTEDQELKLLQKLAKSRKESLEIYTTQNREDLASKEREEIEVIERFLPKPLSEDELAAIIKGVIAEVGAAGPQDMGKVMGAATKAVNGRADGKAISALVKTLLAG